MNISLTKKISMVCLGFLTAFIAPVKTVNGQKAIELQDLSAFKNPGKSWLIVGEVSADLDKANSLNTKAGNGILVNIPSKKNKGEDLFTNKEHGNIDLELDYMMAKGSNSGIYLQGRYEIQLLDSWGSQNNGPGENGGIYERWDEQRPQGQKGYQGYAPRQNVSRAPGLWQHLKISFQAPQFDGKGNKIENAKILSVRLNGVIIHENVELFGPTRGAISEEEAARGPLRFQGDHGAVAFRNIKIVHFDKPRPTLEGLQYTVYGGQYEKEPLYDSLPPEAEGTSTILTSSVRPLPQKFLIKYTGVLDIKEAGEYNFRLHTAGGTGMLKINDKEVIPMGGWSDSNKGKIQLPEGNLPLVLLYSKFVDWYDPVLALAVSGPGVREYLISDVEEMQQGTSVDPILVDAEDTPILRSFMDIPGGHRVTHAVSVGSPKKVHYTYDLDYGTLVQIWRGEFLDATPMWHDRGDGSSRPQGSVLHFLKEPQLTISRLASANAQWPADTTGSFYKPSGYVLDENDLPTFRYSLFGTSIEDAIKVLNDGKGIQRKISVQNPGQELYVRLAKGKIIEEVAKGMYVIDGKTYYLKIDEAGGEKPVLRKKDGMEELIVPVNETISYSILF